MSRLKLEKKLQPSKKAWKIVTSKIQARIHKLNIPQVVKTTIHRIATTLQTFRFLIPRKHRSLTRPSWTSHGHVRRKNFAAVHIDQLFGDSVTGRHVWKHTKEENTRGETSSGKEVMMNDDHREILDEAESNRLDSIEDAWKVVVASSPQLRIDERAEEFIFKFRQDMKIQKEKSLLEFQERLARSS